MLDHELLFRLRQIVEADLTNPRFDTRVLVKRLGMSERSLYRRLKGLTLLTPAAYLRAARLARARELLQSQALRTVAEVAYAVGFEHPGYFAKVYYRHFGERATTHLYKVEQAAKHPPDQRLAENRKSLAENQ